MNADILDAIYADGCREPRGLEVVLMASPQFAAVWNATNANIGRDRRRIKREIRKAVAKARRDHSPRIGGIDRSTVPFWRNSAVMNG